MLKDKKIGIIGTGNMIIRSRKHHLLGRPEGEAQIGQGRLWSCHDDQ
jgi:hypothetical protein